MFVDLPIEKKAELALRMLRRASKVPRWLANLPESGQLSVVVDIIEMYPEVEEVLDKKIAECVERMNKPEVDPSAWGVTE